MSFEEPAWISEEPRNHAVFETLVAFLNSASIHAANVDELAGQTVDSLVSHGTQNPSRSTYASESFTLFAKIFTLASQLPPTAPQQEHLLHLVLAFRSVPLPPSVEKEIDEYDIVRNPNHALSAAKTIFSDFDADAPVHPRQEDRPNAVRAMKPRRAWRTPQGVVLPAQTWTNANAFMARLHAGARDIIHLDLWGLYAMIEALEQPLSPSKVEEVLPAAACWVVFAGEALKGNNVPYANGSDSGGTMRLPWSRGELWKGPSGFSAARWEFWMQRFREIAERRDVTDDVREFASWAVENGA